MSVEAADRVTTTSIDTLTLFISQFSSRTIELQFGLFSTIFQSLGTFKSDTSSNRELHVSLSVSVEMLAIWLFAFSIAYPGWLPIEHGISFKIAVIILPE